MWWKIMQLGLESLRVHRLWGLSGGSSPDSFPTLPPTFYWRSGCWLMYFYSTWSDWPKTPFFLSSHLFLEVSHTDWCHLAVWGQGQRGTLYLLSLLQVPWSGELGPSLLLQWGSKCWAFVKLTQHQTVDGDEVGLESSYACFRDPSFCKSMDCLLYKLIHMLSSSIVIIALEIQRLSSCFIVGILLRIKYLDKTLQPSRAWWNLKLNFLHFNFLFFPWYCAWRTESPIISSIYLIMFSVPVLHHAQCKL